ncbi:sigma-70 family RNA polymerase sigma factor [Amorphoplanes nipponensis]|uniref:Siderophore-interacting protein n=1 Tax=Actinoplanes nipponensis TaxID=135950 RepID=A0A919JL89_9ACTN|nr:RNA polymerase sigma factor [Actinoplanes nipponensis]GIE53084.1 siderophore-interacting protein [Actinoplanes nipponensis]
MNSSQRARIRAGDTAAFGQLFEDHARAVYRHVVRSSGSWSSAEDIVSLTFLEAWRLRGSLRPDGDSVLPWLLGIAVNVTRNSRRTARRHASALIRLPPAEAMPDFADELVNRMRDSEQLAAAATALHRLRPAEREVFTLCVWSGLDYAQAAEALGVPVGTVRSRLSRARARLRELTADVPGPREPERGSGQVQGGRTGTARSHQEGNR